MSTESNYKHYTRGGQISFHNLRMWDQITKTLLYCCLAVWFLTSGLVMWFFTGTDRLMQTAIYYYALFLNLVKSSHTFDIPYHGYVLKRSVHDLVSNPYYSLNANACLDSLFNSALIGGGASLVLGALLAVYFIRKGKFQAKNQFIRGTSLLPSKKLKKQIIRAGKGSDLNFDGFPLIKDCEVQHLLVHGTVGMGKSQLIMKLMDGLRARGDRVIVYDKGCTFTESYFQESSDVLLNPFDARCANWDLWAEAPRDELLENMAESLIPMHGESDPFWVNAARTVLSSAASKMRHDPNRSLEKLLRLLVTGEFTELEPYLTGTAAATLVSNKIEKTAISIRSVITTYLKSMQSLSGLNDERQQCVLMRMSKNPETMPAELIKKLCDGHSTYVVFDSDAYYIGHDLKPKKLVVTDFELLSKIFPVGLNEPQNATQACLTNITLLTSHTCGKVPFSIRDYILNPDCQGWLFISSNGEQHKSLRPLISMWIAMASLTLLSLPENQNRRIWFICDELPSLHKLPLLGETIAEVRKFGGCFLLGMQSFSQLVKVYGRSGAAEIFDLLNTRAFFASPSHEMAQLVSKELGEEEVDDARENYSYGANSIRDGISLGKNRVTRPIVTYPEIMGLQALECFLRLPGHPITKLTLKHQKRVAIADGFIARPLPQSKKTDAASAMQSTCNESSFETNFEARVEGHIPKKKNPSFEMESVFES